MSDGYTPTTANVRDCYVYAEQQYDGDVANPVHLAVAEFDRWLAAHDREVAATERERCARIAEAQAIHPDIEPHLTADFREGHRDALIDAAAAIRAGDA